MTALAFDFLIKNYLMHGSIWPVTIQDGWPSSGEQSQAENRQCLYSWHHRTFFLAMRIAREASALSTTSKSSNLGKLYLTYWLYWIVQHVWTLRWYIRWHANARQMVKHQPECFFVLARFLTPTTLKWSPQSLPGGHGNRSNWTMHKEKILSIIITSSS